MANVYAVTNGNWSNTAIWNTGSLPATIDDVYSNNFTVYVNNNYQVNFVTNLSATGITAGGRFILNNGISLSANVIGGGANQVACVQFLSASPSFCTLVGNLCAVNTTISGPRALLNNSSGTFTVYGNGLGRIKSVAGNPADGYIQNQSTGTLNLFGNYIAGVNVNAVVDNRGIWNQGGGIINLVGQLSGANNAGSQGLYNQTGTVNITGNIIANFGGGLQSNDGIVNIIGNVFSTNSTGLNNQTTSTINLQGDIIAGNGEGARNASNTNPINVVGNIQGGTANTAAGISNTGTGTVNITGNIIGGTSTNANGINNNNGTTTIFGNVSGGNTGLNISLGGANVGGGVLTIFGNVHAGSSSGSVKGMDVGNATVRIIGNVFGNNLAGGASHSGIEMNGATGVVSITGNCYAGGGSGSFCSGVRIRRGTLNILGNVYGAPRQGNATNSGITTTDNNQPTINIIGNVYGGDCFEGGGYFPSGIANPNNANIFLSGSAIGGTTTNAFGVQNAGNPITGGTGIARIKRAVGNNWGLGYTTALGPAPGVYGGPNSSTIVEELECGPRGQWPTSGIVYFTPNPKATSQFETDTFQNYSLIQSISADNLLPPISSVRQGTVYDLGMDTGTCIIPPASSVALNVLVDNLSGTAVLTPTNVWNISASQIIDNQSIGGRLRNTLTVNAAERLLNSFNI